MTIEDAHLVGRDSSAALCFRQYQDPDTHETYYGRTVWGSDEFTPFELFTIKLDLDSAISFLDRYDESDIFCPYTSDPLSIVARAVHVLTKQSYFSCIVHY